MTRKRKGLYIAIIIFICNCIMSVGTMLAFGATDNELSIDDYTALPGGSFVAYVSVSDVSQLAALELQMYYDDSVLEVKSASTYGILSGSMTTINTSNSGVVALNFISSDGVSGSGKILAITFSVLDDAEYGLYSLTLGVGDAYTSSLSIVNFSTQSGSVEICEPTTSVNTISYYGSITSSVQYNENVEFKVYTYNTYALSAGDFDFTFDASIFEFVELQTSAYVSNDNAILSINSSISGLVKVSYASTQAITSGTGMFTLVLKCINNVSLATSVAFEPKNMYDSSLNIVNGNSLEKSVAIEEIIPEIEYQKVYLGSSSDYSCSEHTISMFFESDLNIAAGDFVVSYDSSAVICTAVNVVIESAFIEINANYSSGEVKFSYVNLSPPTDLVEVVEMVFVVVDEQKVTTDLSVTGTKVVDMNFNEVLLEYQGGTIAALGHELIKTDAVAATCEEDGNIAYWTCGVCEKIFSDEAGTKEITFAETVLAATGHNYIAVVTAPTCTEQGYTTYTCSVCGDSYVTDYVDALGHSYTSEYFAGDCENYGYTVYTCSICGDTYTVYDTEYEECTYTSVVTAPTCTEQGYTTYTCSVCGDSYVVDYVDALGHNLIKTDAVAATCEEDGNIAYWTCSGCEKIFSDEAGTTEITFAETVLAATGHNYIAVVTEPTCTEQGYTTYTCSICGDSYVADYVDALGHTLTKIDAVAATCEEDGNIAYWTCSGCEKIFSDEAGTKEITFAETVLAATGHNYIAVVTEPTCTEQGYTTYTCSICGDSYVDDYVDALGHDYTSEYFAGDCENYGYTVYTCSICGDTYTVYDTEYEECTYTSEVTAPTCTEQGYTTYTCSVCGDSYVTDYVDALGHTLTKIDAVAATTETEGNIEYYVCSVCGALFSDALGQEEIILAQTVIEKLIEEEVAQDDKDETTGDTEGGIGDDTSSDTPGQSDDEPGSSGDGTLGDTAEQSDDETESSGDDTLGDTAEQSDDETESSGDDTLGDTAEQSDDEPGSSGDDTLGDTAEQSDDDTESSGDDTETETSLFGCGGSLSTTCVSIIPALIMLLLSAIFLKRKTSKSKK